MSKFKVGDKVKKKEGVNRGEWDEYPYVTIKTINGDRVWSVETDTYCRISSIELYNDLEGKRTELVDAIRLVQSYQIGIFASDGELYAKGHTKEYKNPQDLVDVLLPLETPNQAKLRELEEQQRAIAEQMELLRTQL